MEAAGKVASAFSINIGVFKEPRGFIKPIQWDHLLDKLWNQANYVLLFDESLNEQLQKKQLDLYVKIWNAGKILSIFAFATTVSVQTDLKFDVMESTNSTPVSQGTKDVMIKYPFNLDLVTVWTTTCNTSMIIETRIMTFLQGSKPSAEFFVFVGVIVFLYCLAALVLYIFFDNIYRRSNTFTIADFIVSVIIVLLWLISSSAWAQGVSDLKYYTNLKDCGLLGKMESACVEPKYTFHQTVQPNFASLNVSIIFGFLNMLVWGGNLWFLWKETPWAKVQSKPPTMSGQEQGNQKI